MNSGTANACSTSKIFIVQHVLVLVHTVRFMQCVSDACF
jgi:hypothetical protein